MKNIFENKYYPTVMFLLISITTILIIFNFINISEEVAKISSNQTKKVTGFVITNEKQITNTIEKSKTVFTKKAFYIYNFTRIFLIFLISILSIRLIIPRLSK